MDFGFRELLFGQRRLFTAPHGLCTVSPCWMTSHVLWLVTGISATYLLDRKVFSDGYYSRKNACYYSVQNLLSSRLLSKKLKNKIYRTIILPVVLYGCETWSLTLREKRRLRVFENRMLRRVFGPKRDEVTGEWRKLHNEELSDLYSLPNIVRVLK